jgi:hypothetical protein
MKIQLEKEVKWESGKSVTKYWVLVDDKHVGLAYNEEEALDMYEKTKANYVKPSRETIREEEL